TAILLGGRALASEDALRTAGRIAAATHTKLFAEVFPTRFRRGAVLPPLERIAYVPELASVQLAGLKHLILVDTKAPVTFFAYPGKRSYLVPDGCEVPDLASPGDDVAGSLAALAEELGAAAGEPIVQQHGPPPRPTGTLTAESVCQAIGATLPE